MNLNNFEKHIEPKILDRGFSYYEYDYVQEVEQVGRKEFSAAVLGSEEYSVYIQLSEALEVISHDCDCPYEWGAYCKHEVAVLYYLKDSKLYEEPVKEGKIGKIRNKLKELKKEEIVEILIELAKKNRNLRDEIMEELGLNTI